MAYTANLIKKIDEHIALMGPQPLADAEASKLLQELLEKNVPLDSQKLADLTQATTLYFPADPTNCDASKLELIYAHCPIQNIVLPTMLLTNRPLQDTLRYSLEFVLNSGRNTTLSIPDPQKAIPYC